MLRLIPALLLFFCAGAACAAETAAPKAKPKPKNKTPDFIEANPRPGRRAVEDHDDLEIVPRRDIPKEMETEDAPSPYLRWMLQPIKRGMWIRLPIMDTDPNRGITLGFMPIWVIKEPNGDRIQHIHAPSVTYNKNFKVTPTYRYYYYPREDTTLIARASLGKYEREVMAEYEDGSVAGTELDAAARLQYNVDAGKRFFGIGPNTSKSAEANYKEDYLQFRGSVGVPIRADSHWRVRLGSHVEAMKLENGPIPGLPGFDSLYPGVAPRNRQQSHELRATLDYDSRDHATTTTSGAFMQIYREQAIRGFASAYHYRRMGFDGRLFLPWKTTGRRKVTAIHTRYEQLYGDAPFWLLPRLGGKYNLRAYGEGRYIDRALVSVNVEQRFTLFDVKMAGVTTEFEVAPFAGVGTVADKARNFSGNYARPVVGGAVRAVARPQVVGSIDFGVGQEGLAVFMDINYSF